MLQPMEFNFSVYADCNCADCGVISAGVAFNVSKELGAIVGIVLAFIGVVASIMWFFFNRRYEKIIRYWVVSARELEEKMSEHVKIVQRGRRLSEGEMVAVSGETIGYDFWGKLPIRNGYAIVHIIFILVFLGLMLLNCSRLGGGAS